MSVHGPYRTFTSAYPGAQSRIGRDEARVDTTRVQMGIQNHGERGSAFRRRHGVFVGAPRESEWGYGTAGDAGSVVIVVGI